MDEAVDDIRVITDRYGGGLLGLVAKMRLLSIRVLKGRIGIGIYLVDVVAVKKESEQVMSNNFYGEPDSTCIAAEVVSSDPINVFLSSNFIYGIFLKTIMGSNRHRD